MSAPSCRTSKHLLFGMQTLKTSPSRKNAIAQKGTSLSIAMSSHPRLLPEVMLSTPLCIPGGDAPITAALTEAGSATLRGQAGRFLAVGHSDGDPARPVLSPPSPASVLYGTGWFGGFGRFFRLGKGRRTPASVPVFA